MSNELVPVATNYLSPKGVIAATEGGFTPKVVVGRIGHPQVVKMERTKMEEMQVYDTAICNLTPTLLSLAVKHVNEGIIAGQVTLGK
jgi:hypothetical protein